jgi:hypothetical protein
MRREGQREKETETDGGAGANMKWLTQKHLDDSSNVSVLDVYAKEFAGTCLPRHWWW